MRVLIHFLKQAGKLGFILFLLVITFVYAMFQGGFVSWFLFYSFLPLGLYSLFLSIYPIGSFEVERETNQSEYTAGEKLIGTVTVKRRIPFPLVYLIVEEVLPLELQYHDQQQKTKVLLFPWFKRTISFQYEFESIPRGEHVFSTIRVKTGDLFGLVEKEASFPLHARFLVYPKYYDMVYRQIESRFEQGMTASNVNLQRDTTIAIGIRDYKPGDRFSWIDWKSSARKNNIMTKEFEQQQSHDVVLFLDRSPSKEFEQSVTFMASLARAILRKGAQVSLISVGEERTLIPLKGGESQFQHIFFHLAKVKADNQATISQTVDSELSRAYQAVTFMFVTSTVTNDLVTAIEKLSFRRVNILVFIAREKASQMTGQEQTVIDMLRKRNVIVKVVYEGHYTDVFFEVNQS